MPAEHGGNTEHVPPEDISYAVETALWVARSAVATRTSTVLDYTGIFERQLTTHWDALLALHGSGDEPEQELEDDGTEQTRLVTDGGTATLYTDDYWPCGRPMGGYAGSFPRGFLTRLKEDLGLPIHTEDVLFPFGGLTPTRDNWHVNDIRGGQPTGPNGEPLPADSTHDARDLPEEWTDRWPIVIEDPPYGVDYSAELYGVEYPRPSEHMSEASRVVAPGGYVIILDQLVYNLEWAHDDHPLEREAVVPVTTGPGMRARATNVLRAPGESAFRTLDDFGGVR